jgi:hypothetical protein
MSTHCFLNRLSALFNAPPFAFCFDFLAAHSCCLLISTFHTYIAYPIIIRLSILSELKLAARIKVNPCAAMGPCLKAGELLTKANRKKPVPHERKRLCEKISKIYGASKKRSRYTDYSFKLAGTSPSASISTSQDFSAST